MRPGARPTGEDAVSRGKPPEPPEHRRAPEAGQTGGGAAYHRPVNTIVELLDSAAARFGDRPALRLRGDDNATVTWTYRELLRRSRIAAWRLRSLGLEP